MVTYWKNWDNWWRRDGGEMQWLERLQGIVGLQPGCQRQLDQSRESKTAHSLPYSQTFPHFTGLFVVIVQSLSHVQLFATSWTAAHQVSLSFAISLRLLKLMSIELVMSSSHLILYRPLLLLLSLFPSIRVFSNESDLCIRWPKYWSFSFSISPSNEYSGFISFGIHWFHLFAV